MTALNLRNGTYANGERLPAGDPSAGGSRIASTELQLLARRAADYYSSSSLDYICVNEQAYIWQAAADRRLANGRLL